MSKGFFSQGVCFLTTGQANIEDVKHALTESGYQILKQVAGQENWCFSGPSVVVSYLPQVNGLASVDVVNHAWPDTMGNPNSDPMTFGAWSMGHFGPYAFPGGLGRAQQHAWAWPEGRTVADSHGGLIRVRTSYVFGSGDNAPILPKDYDPLAEMHFLGQVSMAILTVPGVLCYFNPNGEVLRDRSRFSQILDACTEQNKLPLPLWANIRFFNLNENLGLMDTVGNEQLDISDIEAIFPKSTYNPRDVDYYLRNVTQYLLDTDREIHSGEAFDGPGESNLSWVAEVLEKGLVQPARRMLRLYPSAIRGEIETAIAAVTNALREHQLGDKKSPSRKLGKAL